VQQQTKHGRYVENPFPTYINPPLQAKYITENLSKQGKNKKLFDLW
jgi:hypothetical protein